MGRRWASSSSVNSAGGPSTDRSTGRRTRPFSIPNTVRIANTAKKYLKDGAKQGVSLFIKQTNKQTPVCYTVCNFLVFYIDINKATHASA